MLKIFSDIDSNPIQNDEDLNNKIKLIEDLTNFNMKKNICISCLEKLIQQRENLNNLISIETENIITSLVNITIEVESEEFSNFFFFYNFF